MESLSFKVTGATAGQLPELLADVLGVTALVKHGDVTVLCQEKYYWRIDSNLMSTVVLSMIEENTCFVDIVTGGGKKGIWSISFGAEKKNTSMVAAVLDTVCQKLELRVTPS